MEFHPDLAKQATREEEEKEKEEDRDDDLTQRLLLTISSRFAHVC